jgi:hypothetical protein
VDHDSLGVWACRPEKIDFPLPEPLGLEVAQVSGLVQTDALATRRLQTHAP